MDYLSGFCHRVVQLGYTLSHAVAATPEVLASLPEKISTIAKNAFHAGTKIYEGIKHIWKLGPVQVTKNASQTVWAATQLVRQPELVLKQLPNAANVVRYGAMTFSFYMEVGGQYVSFNPQNLDLLANGTELYTICKAPHKVSKKQLLDFMSKLTQVIAGGTKMIMDQETADTLYIKSLEAATTALGIASCAFTIYIYRDEINEVRIVLRDMLDTVDQDMADAEPDEIDQKLLFGEELTKEELKNFDKPSKEQELKTQPASPVKIEEGEPVKKEVKKDGIANPTSKLSKGEEEEIDREVRRIWFS